jgi:protein TonB
MIFPVTNFYFMGNIRASVLGNMSHGGVTLSSDRPWVALGLVLCAHLAAFAALYPQPQPLALETIPVPIMVSLLSAPQKPTPSAQPVTKAQKPIKKQAKPISKPAVPQIKQATQPIAPVEQTSTPVAAPSAPIAEQETKAAADTQAYQPPSFNAAYLNNPPPDYPSVSRRLGEQGKVLLLVQITADGAAGSVTLQTSSGSTRLDQAALEAVKKWRFVPAKRGEQAVSASVVVPVRFSIEG